MTIPINQIVVRDAVMPADLAVVRTLFQEYAEGLDVDLCFQAFAEELAGLPGKYARPAGGVLLAVRDDDIAGCVALRPENAERAEIKRMYVRPAFRGAGVGRTLLEHVLRAAADIGYRRVCLDTLRSMTRAIALYRSLGFVDVPAYTDNPVPGALFLGREL